MPRRSDTGAGSPTTGSDQQIGLLRLLFFFLLSVLGAFGALFVVASRKPTFERSWDDFEPLDEELDGLEPPEDLAERPLPSQHAVSLEVEGPAGALFVDDGGAPGRPVVFIHGLGGSSRQWQAQLSHLRPERRAAALDLRGHGDSEASAEGRYSLEDYADDLAAAMDALEIGRAVLVGHSLGATVALLYADRQPERVAGILMVDPNADQTRIPEDQAETILSSVASDPRGEMEWSFKQILVGAEPGVADQVLADLQLADRELFHPTLASAFSTSPLPALEGFDGPVAAIVTDMNTLPISLHRLEPELPWELVPRTSHWVMMDAPEEVNELLDGFLEEVSLTPDRRASGHSRTPAGAGPEGI